VRQKRQKRQKGVICTIYCAFLTDDNISGVTETGRDHRCQPLIERPEETEHYAGLARAVLSSNFSSLPRAVLAKAFLFAAALTWTAGGATTIYATEVGGYAVVFAQTNTSIPAAVSPISTLTFDVASIHVSAPSTDGHHHIWNDVHESQFRTGNLSIRELIQFAYNVPKSQILGGPDWLDAAMYDIDAKSSPEVDAQLKAMPADDAGQQKRLMTRALLKERFSITAHEETRQLPLYNLVLAKGGAKFKPSDHAGTTIEAGRSRLHVQGSDDTMGLLTRQLAQSLGRVVLNETGLTGRYDLTLRWTPDDAPPPLLNGEPDPNAPPGIFTAIQEQLGLKLESGKGPVPVLVIDRIEHPSEN
jgi:uncharacterized protein (TIGR03435 family)